MTRRSISTRRRAAIFADAGGICSICGEKIDGIRDRWEVSHEVPLALGGADEDANMRPAHYACHRRQTAETDIPAIAKAKRVATKHGGAHRPRSTIPGSKGSGWRKPLHGPAIRVQE